MPIMSALSPGGEMPAWQRELLERRKMNMMGAQQAQPVSVGGKGWLPQGGGGSPMDSFMSGMGDIGGGDSGGGGGGFLDSFLNNTFNNVNIPGAIGQLLGGQAPSINPSIPGLNPLEPNIPFRAPNSPLMQNNLPNSFMDNNLPNMLNGPLRPRDGTHVFGTSQEPYYPPIPRLQGNRMPFGLPAGSTPSPVSSPAPQPTVTPTPPSGNSSLDAIAHAIGKVETGGVKGNPYLQKTDAGKGRIALGKYQILNTNVGKWSQQVLGKKLTPMEFLNDPTAQEQIARAKFKEYYDTYGTPQDVAAMWFSGRPAKNNNAAEAKTGFSVPRYLNRFNNFLSTYKGGRA